MRRFAIFFLLASLAAIPGHATIQYTISLAHPEQHFFHVTVRPDPISKSLTVQLPAWNALYQIRDFAHRVSDLRAGDKAGHALTVTKLDKQTWRVLTEGAAEIKYEIYWDDPGPFNSQLNAAHAFLNLAEVLVYLPDRRNEGAELQLVDVPEAWKVATPLNLVQRGGSRERAFLYSAGTYDELVDGPIEVGKFESLVVRDGAPRIVAVIHGDNWKPEQIAGPLQKICAHQIAMMGGAPFEQYTFIFHIGSGAGGGGMEHANSTAISVPSGESIAGVSAHEFFHAWNVKRIRPESLEPVDYTREMWTRALWFAEGVTSTYGAYTLVRTGLWNKEAFFADLAAQITELELRPANRWKSAEEASLDAWLEKYPLYHRWEFSISYYTKGQVLGVLLDVVIRDATDNRSSLDDVMRGLNEEFAKKGKFYDESEDIRSIAEKISGRPLHSFFERYVSGHDKLPYSDVLALAGLTLKTTQRAHASFGFWPKPQDTQIQIVSELDAEGAAALAGLREGDVLLELNGATFPRRSERWLREHAAGETAKLRIRRGTEEKEISFALGSRTERFDQIEEAARPTDKQRRIREGLLRGTTKNESR